MSNVNMDQIVDQLSQLSVIQIAQLTKLLEDKWGVKAAPVAVAAGPVAAGGAAAAAPAAAEQTEFSVILASAGANKIGVIKVVRELTNILMNSLPLLRQHQPLLLQKSNSLLKAGIHLWCEKCLREAPKMAVF